MSPESPHPTFHPTVVCRGERVCSRENNRGSCISDSKNIHQVPAAYETLFRVQGFQWREMCPLSYGAYFHLNERGKRVYKMAKIISGPDKGNEEHKAMRQRVMEGAL